MCIPLVHLITIYPHVIQNSTVRESMGSGNNKNYEGLEMSSGTEVGVVVCK